jgi:hypothetical protein
MRTPARRGARGRHGAPRAAWDHAGAAAAAPAATGHNRPGHCGLRPALARAVVGSSATRRRTS